MDGNWTGWLERWRDAGLIDADTAARIRAYEGSHERTNRLRWPILIALAFGALMVCGGILLFVAANWDALSPTVRFMLVLLLVGGFHVAGAAADVRFPAMSEALHGVGTAVLGGGIALSGQIFNLAEHWPGGIMMWALGAGAAWAILRHPAQLALVAILGPAWLVSEWIVAADLRGSDMRTIWVPTAGVFLMALAYVTVPSAGKTTRNERALLWVGCAALLLSGLVVGAVSLDPWSRTTTGGISTSLIVAGWIVAIGAPLAVAASVRRLDAWPNVLASLWMLVLFGMRPLAGDVAVFAWWAVFAIGLVAWGVRDGRSERINLGAAFFSATVLAFYFSQVMDKLGRSASLVGLGVLFLGGGWALERVRRRLVEQSRQAG
jgi:uncharacterized membrane protein